MRRIVLIVFSLVIWCLIVWPYDFQTHHFDWQMTAVGGAVALLSGILLGSVFQKYGKKHTHNIFIRLFWGVLYVPLLFFYILIANFDVLYRVIHPKMPIHPGIVKVKTSLETDTARTVLANSITLTPGTLSVDISDEGVLYIHCINTRHRETEEEKNRIISRFEKIIKRIFE